MGTPTRGVVIATVIVAVAAAGVGVAVKRSEGDDSGTPTAAEKAALRRMAAGYAADNGDPHPRSMVVVAARRGDYLNLGGHRSSTDPTSVFVVRMTGRFTYKGPHPDGAAAPHGHLLVLAFDADTLELRDLELGDHLVEVERLGAVQKLAAG